MDHCTITATCEVCVDDEACYWVTLANKTLICSQDLVQMGIDYLGSIEKADGCVNVASPEDTLLTATTAGLVTGAVAITAGIFGIGWWVTRCRNRNRSSTPPWLLNSNSGRQRLFGSRDSRSDRDLFIGPTRQSINTSWRNTSNKGTDMERGDVELTSFLATDQNTFRNATMSAQNQEQAIEQNDEDVEAQLKNDEPYKLRALYAGPSSASNDTQGPSTCHHDSKPNVQPPMRSSNSAVAKHDWHKEAAKLNARDEPACYTEQITTRHATIKFTETKLK